LHELKPNLRCLRCLRFDFCPDKPIMSRPQVRLHFFCCKTRLSALWKRIENRCQRSSFVSALFCRIAPPSCQSASMYRVATNAIVSSSFPAAGVQSGLFLCHIRVLLVLSKRLPQEVSAHADAMRSCGRRSLGGCQKGEWPIITPRLSERQCKVVNMFGKFEFHVNAVSTTAFPSRRSRITPFSVLLHE
jgi:hypothetical protein